MIIRHVPHKGRNFQQAGSLRRSQSSFSCYQLVRIAEWTHEDRLQDAVCANRAGKLVEALFVQLQPRLMRIGDDLIDVELSGNRLGMARFRYQRLQPSAQDLSFHG